MARLAITIEGGLISSDLVEQIAATPQDVPGQRPADFGLDARLSDEIQKAFSEALIYWNAFNARLARRKESATTITRETWVLPLLEELGFALVFQRAAATAGGGTFSISHRLGTDPDAPPIHIVSCEQELDRKGDATRSAHALVQDYLNRSTALWGIVTNGMTLRLLRNTVRFSRPSYIEFDLEAIFKGNLYSEFVLFYRLVHATRLPKNAGEAHECWLEKYYQQGIEQGGRVRERLRDGVQEALEILGTELLAHHESGGLRGKFDDGRLSKVDYYRQLLRLIYRLLFLMVAEERRLLFVRSNATADRQAIYDRWYSIERLRKRTDSRFFDDGHSDLWEGLKQTFRLFEDTASASQLGLTALDGELFGRLACADLIDTRDGAGPRLRNDRLLSAIWRLSTFEDADGRRKSGVRRRVNFAGLDVEELGSVYESLLDYHPEVKIDGERSKFELIAGTERKSTGSYYTPPELVRELIKSALEPMIEDRLAKAKTRDEKERSLLALKICDPASGSGHFMLAAARRLGRELARVRSGEAEPNPADYRHAIRDVIRYCIYAVDKNPLAVDLCKVALWIEGHEPGLPLSFLDHHVKSGDSLVGVFDLDALRKGAPDDAYKPVTGDDKKVAARIKKTNKDEKKETLFGGSVEDDIDRIASAFAAIADRSETTPDEVHAKQTAYAALRHGEVWERAKWACDLWTAAFFAPLTESEIAAVPTTEHVWQAARGREPQGRVAAVTKDLALAQPFFHWPLEFPEVFSGGESRSGFDVMLGNPPWDVSQSAGGESGDADLDETNETPESKRNVGCQNKFFRNSGFFSNSAHGKLNYYALFTERFAVAIASTGSAGFIVPTGLVTDESSAKLFHFLLKERSLKSFHGFENEKFLFPGIANIILFGLATVFGNPHENAGHEFCFYLRSIQQLQEDDRLLLLSPEEIALFDPITQVCPSFRSKSDVELTRKIYERLPILRRSQSEEDNPWQISYRQGLFNMNQDKRRFIKAARNAGDVDVNENAPLYEAKYIWLFDHRFGSYHRVGRAKGRGGRGLPPTLAEEHADPLFEITPRYYVSRQDVQSRLVEKHWQRDWLIGWRDITRAKVERTSVWAVIPRAGVGHTLPLLFSSLPPKKLVGLIGNLNAIVFDFLVRQKLGGTHFTFGILDQLVALPPSAYSDRALDFITVRVLELTYTSNSVRGFARDLGYDGPPFKWDSGRRAVLQAELDAYFAYLYGVTKRELEYILDPNAVMGEEYPSETFRVLKEREGKEFGEYRTQRLVLDAWDRFVIDGTFDPALLHEPQYIDAVAQELAVTRAKLEQVEQDSKVLLKLASETPKPTLFVEGVTDAKIIEAAWAVFFPKEPMPVKVIAAGGTKEMGSLAGKGKALREVLGEQTVLVVADNDSAGRRLTDDGHVRKGGTWRQLPNGIHWCLLRPSSDFAGAMKAYNVPPDYWPFTIEAAFPPVLRRQAEAEGAWRFSGTPQAELLDNPDLARRLFAVVPKLGPDDDAYWYLMAPHPDAKEAFASWVTDPKRRTEDNYAAFEEMVRGIRSVLTPAGDDSEATTQVRGAA